MIDRGIKKWQPFNSCFSNINVINDIKRKKERKNFPILSEDQINSISENVIDAYNLKIAVSIIYFYNGDFKKINGFISYIDLQEKKICLNNKVIYFKQILKIDF